MSGTPLVPQNQIDASVTQLYPKHSVAIDASGGDVDLTALFPQKYARRLYVGVSAPSDVSAVLAGNGGTVVVYKNVPQGTYLTGCFVTVKQATTASHIVAEE